MDGRACVYDKSERRARGARKCTVFTSANNVRSDPLSVTGAKKEQTEKGTFLGEKIKSPDGPDIYIYVCAVWLDDRCGDAAERRTTFHKSFPVYTNFGRFFDDNSRNDLDSSKRERERKVEQMVRIERERNFSVYVRLCVCVCRGVSEALSCVHRKLMSASVRLSRRTGARRALARPRWLRTSDRPTAKTHQPEI